MSEDRVKNSIETGNANLWVTAKHRSSLCIGSDLTNNFCLRKSYAPRVPSELAANKVFPAMPKSFITSSCSLKQLTSGSFARKSHDFILIGKKT